MGLLNSSRRRVADLICCRIVVKHISWLFNLFPTTTGTYLTLDELKEQTKDAQTDKDGKLIQLYAANTDEQHAYIEAAKAKGYTVLLLDSPIVGHLLQKLEQEDDKLGFVRVDSDHIEECAL